MNEKYTPNLVAINPLVVRDLLALLRRYVLLTGETCLTCGQVFRLYANDDLLIDFHSCHCPDRQAMLAASYGM